MDNRLAKSIINNSPVIDFDAIIKGNKNIEKASSKVHDITSKLNKVKELCCKDNLYVQGMSMDGMIEEYLVDVKSLAEHLDQLNSQLNKAIYKSQSKQVSKASDIGGVR